MPRRPIEDQVIVITGASSGFGRGAALAFAEQGACVVLAARRVSLLETLAEECEAKGGKAIAVPTDVSNNKQVEALAAAAISTFGRIDTWINNAGVAAIGAFEEVPLADHEQVLKTNLFGTLYGSYAAFTQFRKQGYGNLINTASMLGKVAAPYYASYNASKHALVGFCATLRLEIKERKLENIHVCAVLPMAMDTPFFDHAANYTGREAVPIPPTYDAQKVVDTIVKLATDPEDEVIVGGAGVLADIAHRVMPSLAERGMAKEVQIVQMETPKPVAHTSGSVHAPMMEGAGLHGKKKANA